MWRTHIRSVTQLSKINDVKCALLQGQKTPKLATLNKFTIKQLIQLCKVHGCF